jgi:Calx-beta domain
MAGTGGLNIFSGNSQAQVSNNVQGVPATYFVNAAGGNFRLTSNATGAINTGVSLSSMFTTDADGAARPQGSAWDLGAYEFGGTVTPVPGQIQFTASGYTVDEAAGTATISVSRMSGSLGVVGITYSTSVGTATFPSDFTFTTGTLSWADGDTANKSFTVPIINDSTSEQAETFNVILSAPTGGATLGSPSTAPVNILDNDIPLMPGLAYDIPLMPGLAFEAEAGAIDPPFTVGSGLVSQTIDAATPSEGGRARYRVTIPSTGNYRVNMNVNAPNTAANLGFAV